MTGYCLLVTAYWLLITYLAIPPRGVYKRTWTYIFWHQLWETIMRRATVAMAVMAACAMAMTGCGMFSPPTVTVRTASADNADAFKAGQTAAQALKDAMGDCTPKVVFVTECFDGLAAKTKVLEGVASVLGADVIVGASSYGTFTQDGPKARDAVGLMAIGGPDVRAETALVDKMGAVGLTPEKDQAALAAALGGAGAKLAGKLTKADDSKLLIILADAHSPKNALFIEGVQTVVGKDFPITGGSVNKNAGQSFVFYKGKAYGDAAVAVMLSGKFTVAMTGRQAKSNDAVIATAREGSAEALKNLEGKPVAMLAFNCAGRKGKLDNLADEMAAIQDSAGTDLPVFGCWCAGEFGPADVAEPTPGQLSSGCGWHVMVTVIGQ